MSDILFHKVEEVEVQNRPPILCCDTTTKHRRHLGINPACALFNCEVPPRVHILLEQKIHGEFCADAAQEDNVIQTTVT